MKKCYFDFGKVILLHGCFSPFLNCANGTKWRKTSNFMNAQKKLTTSDQNFNTIHILQAAV